MDRFRINYSNAVSDTHGFAAIDTDDERSLLLITERQPTSFGLADGYPHCYTEPFSRKPQQLGDGWSLIDEIINTDSDAYVRNFWFCDTNRQSRGQPQHHWQRNGNANAIVFGHF